jgi:leader peptidase (prepilin peptidase)/N-methyltransferase
MTVIDYVRHFPAFYIPVAGLTGLIVGSFLNVVIHRLPIMMERQWRNHCREFMAGEGDTRLDHPVELERYDLVSPGSRCPHCGHAIRALENIPVISYLVLRGRCAACKASISPRYPIIELSAAMLSMIVAWRLGFTPAAGAGLVLTWALLSLSVIDMDHQMLPDVITLPLLWLGLLLNLNGVYTDIHASVIGAVAGYLALWTVYKVFKWFTGKEGMGYGDFKLLAMLGAWLGWQALPVVILLSSVVGAVVGITLIAVRGQDRNIPIPFGPYLAAAGWIALLWGKDLTAYYFSMMGLD